MEKQSFTPTKSFLSQSILKVITAIATLLLKVQSLIIKMGKDYI